MFPVEPGPVIGEVDGAAARPAQLAGEAVVQEDVEGNPAAAARHQNMVSMSAADALPRGLMSNSRSHAASRRKIVLILAIGRGSCREGVWQQVSVAAAARI